MSHLNSCFQAMLHGSIFMPCSVAGDFSPLPSTLSQTTINTTTSTRVRTGSVRRFRSRTPIIENPKDLAAQFACAVTIYSANQSDWVARNGNESIYRTLRRILPEVRSVSAFTTKLLVVAIEMICSQVNKCLCEADF